MEITRERKKIIIIAIYIAIFLSAALLIWLWLKPAATCSDGKQNQNEKGVDCGGVCKPCEETSGKDLIISESAVVFGGNNSWDVLLKVTNPNSNIGSPQFSYAINLLDSAGTVLAQKTGTSYILPAETRNIVEMSLTSSNGAATPARAEVKITNTTWKVLKELEKPDISVFNKNITVQSGNTGVSAYAVLRNDSSYDLAKVDVAIVLRDSQGNVIGLNRTDKDTMRAGEERDFKLSWPYQLQGDVASIDVDVTSNMYNSLNLLDAKYKQGQYQGY